MVIDDGINDLKAKRLCLHCVGDAYLKAEVHRKGELGHCSYCGRRARSFSIEDIAERIETAFEQHFRRTPDEPNSWQQSLQSDSESNYEWFRDGEPVIEAIENAAKVPERVARDIQAILDDEHSDFDSAIVGEETEFCSESHYAEIGPSDATWQEEWLNFEQSLKTEARFFNHIAAVHLASIFNGIDKMSTIDNKPMVIDAGPKMTLAKVFRARVFQSEEKLKEALCRPDLHLGPPPAVLATAGRMNAHGISVFYGTNEASLAISEVRPPVGSWVLVACFDIVRPLRLLDLTALNEVTEVGSIFDPEWVVRLERATFLRSLCQRMTRPVMPDDEIFEYLSTQAIADFLATENKPALDGIMFPSVQTAGNGLNIALFHKAARVESIEIPDKSEVEASTGYMCEEGWEVDYSVVEWVQGEDSYKKKDEQDKLFGLAMFDCGACQSYNEDFRDVTLRIDLKSIKVHVVRGVQFESDVHDVRRHRLEKSDAKF